jgi:hypothetical protein
MVSRGFAHGESAVNYTRRLWLPTALALSGGVFAASSPAQTLPRAKLSSLQPPAGPRVTAYLQYQLDEAWRQDEARQRDWETIRTDRTC